MLNLFKKRLYKRRAVFTVKIDLEFNPRQKQGSLKPGGNYYSSTDRRFSYEELKLFVIKAIEQDFQKDVEKIAWLPVDKIRVIETYTGSIVLVYEILFNSYQFIAGIKDFFDSIRLIQETSDRFLKNRLMQEYGEMFETRSEISYPKEHAQEYLEEIFHRRHRRDEGPNIKIQNLISRRDGLFYYLLISNIILIIIIVLMLYKAAVQVYGW